MFIMSEQKDEVLKNPLYKILVFPVDYMSIAPIPFSKITFSRSETESEYIFSAKITKDQIEKFYDYHGNVKGITVYASNEIFPSIEFLAKFDLERTDDAYKKINISGYGKEINVHLNKLSHLWSVDVNIIGEEEEWSESMNNKNIVINCLCMINPYDLLLNDNNFYLSFNSDNLDTSSGILLESYETEDGLVFAIHLSKNDIETYKKRNKLNRIINLRLYAKDIDVEKPEKWNKSICTFVTHSNIINNIFSFDKDYKIVISYNKMKSKWSLNINDDDYTILESYAINYINRENNIMPDNKCKQIIIYNKETKEQHTGILLNNGNVICGCCGNLIKENLIGNREDKEYQIITIYDKWVNMDDMIGE